MSQFGNDYLAANCPNGNLIGDLLNEIEKMDFESPNILKFHKIFKKKLRSIAVAETTE